MVGAPTKIDLHLSSLDPGDLNEPLRFGLGIGSNKDEKLPIVVEERLYRGSTLIWEKRQTVAVAAFERFFEEIYGLEEDQYRLEVYATYGEQVQSVAEDFEKKRMEEPVIVPAEVEFPMIPFILAVVVVAAAALMLLFYRRTSARRGGR